MEKKTKKGTGSSNGRSAGKPVAAKPAAKTSKSKAESDGAEEEEGETANGKGTQLEKFFVDELKDIYWAEKHLVKSLNKMAKEATTEELRTAFEDHRVETEDHVSRLEEVFEMIGRKPEAKKCEAIAGITKEVDGVIEETEDDTYTRDVALILGGQKAEHYEIATYGGLIQLARVLGYEDAAGLLEETLEEEKAADSLLTEIAESAINEEALTD